MKPPAEKCAERLITEHFGNIYKKRGSEFDMEVQHVASIIQSEYAETFKVARDMEWLEANWFSWHLLIEDRLRNGSTLADAIEFARKSQFERLENEAKAMTPPQQGIKTMGEMR